MKNTRSAQDRPDVRNSLRVQWKAFLIAILLPMSLIAQDTVVVRSTDPGAWRNVRLIEELRIGQVEGDDQYIFGAVEAIVPTSDGSVWVVDGQGPRVRIYDRTGKYVRSVYRKGAGPGEIASVMGMATTPDRKVAIWDLMNKRVSLYRENGEYASSFQALSGWWGGDDFRVDSIGRFWVYTSVRNPACTRRYTAPDGTVREVGSEGPGCGRSAYLRFSPAGVLTDTVYVPSFPETERTPSFVIMMAEGYGQPFIPEWSYALSPRGHFITAHSSRYAINILGGRSVTRIVRTYPPVRLGREEKDEWEGRADFYTRREPHGASGGVKIPDSKPALRGVSVDADGRIWVDRYVAAIKRNDIKPNRPDQPPALTWREPRTFDVFDPTGRFLGTVVAPRNTRFLHARGNQLWGVTRGEFDENYVVRYRLETNGTS